MERVQEHRIKVDLEELKMALQNHSYELAYFLDRETGDIRIYVDGMLDGETLDAYLDEDADEEVEIDLNDVLDPERYERVESISSHESFEVMEAFIEDLPEGHAKRRLQYAVSQRKPFRQFKDALFDLGELREQWFEFEREAYREICQRWLEDHQIDAEIVFRKGSEKYEG